MKKLRKPISILLSLVMVISLFSIVPMTANAEEGIEYVDRTWDETNKVVKEETKTCTNYTPMTNFQAGKSHTLSSGWYVAGNTVFDELTINGIVHIIVPDGVEMIVWEGIIVNNSYDGYGTLDIYGQSGDSGKLTVFNSNNDRAAIGAKEGKAFGDINIHGGTVKAESDDDAAGIGSGKGEASGWVRIYGGKVDAKGSAYGAGIGSGANCNRSGVKVAIYGGEVNATGGKRGAGIGGGNHGQGAAVEIHGGKVTATGGEWGAGIGGGNFGYGGRLYITGGEVTATGGKGAAGVGGGDFSGIYSDSHAENYNDFTFNMSGGKLTAIGGDEAAGIGGGNEQDSISGTISIGGGEIIATGGANYGAGIGGGDQHKGIPTAVWGGKVTATGGKGAAGIGGGDNADANAIRINGGTVTATGGENGAGIGGGNKGNSGVITFDGNTTVTATGGENGAGVGNGNNAKSGGEVKIENGTVNATGGNYAAGIGGGNTGADFCAVNISGGTVTANGGYRAAGIGGGEKSTAGTVNISGGDSVTATGGKGGAGIGKGSNASNDDITVDISGGGVDATGGMGIFHQPQQTSIKCAPGIGGSYFIGTINLRGGNITAHGSFDEHIDSSYNSTYSYGYGTAIGSTSDNERVGTIHIYPGAHVDTYIVNPDNLYSYHYFAKNIYIEDSENGCSSVQYDSTYAAAEDRVKALGWKAGSIHIEPCLHADFNYQDIDGDKHHVNCRYCSFTEEEPHNEVLTAWVWSSDNTAAQAQFTCTDCGHMNYVDATVQSHISSEGDRFEATAVYKGVGYSTTRITDPDGVVIEDGVVVTWENSDGTILESKVVPLGETPVFSGSMPTKPGVDSFRYSFVGWSDGDRNYFTGEDLPEADTQTLYTPIYKYRNQTDPYIDASGAYIPGKERHYLIFNEYFEINGDNSIGPKYDNYDSVEISYFDFELLNDNDNDKYYYRINKYTGPTDNLTELVIPKTYRDNPVTVVGDDYYESKLIGQGNPRFTLVLNENIEKIGNSAFYRLNVTKVTGDTSALKNIGPYAFLEAGGYALDFKFDYPGTITCGDFAFQSLNLTARVKHTTKLGNAAGARNINYVFTDEHIVTPGWHWADDHSSATATFACQDARCSFNETHEATVTSKAIGEKLIYTATVTAMGETFTDVQEVANYTITTVDPENGKIETDMQTALDGDNVNVTVTPDKGYHLRSVSVSKDARVPLTYVRGGNGYENEKGDKLVDGNKTTNWRQDSNGYWTIIMKADQAVSMAGYSLTTGNTVADNPGSNWKKWTVSGGNFAGDSGMEGAADPGWKPLDEVVNDTVLQPENNKTFNFTLSEPAPEYKYYLIRVFESQGADFIQMSEFELKTEGVNVPISGEGNNYSFSMPAFSVEVSAEFEPDLHTVTWRDAEGNDLETDENVPYGSKPEFNGTVPPKDGCTFMGWSDGENIYAPDDLPDVTGDMIFTTVYGEGDGFGTKLAGHSVSLDGDIAVNFYMELSDYVVAHQDTAYMRFEIPDAIDNPEQIMYVRDADVKESGDKRYYVFKCKAAAKEMASQITAQIVDGSMAGTVYTYSVKDYADYLFEHEHDSAEYEQAVPLVKKMLNYGAYAQIYFNNNTENLANKDLSAEDKALGDVTVTPPATVFDLPADVTFEGATLSLKSETTLSLYFASDSELSFSAGEMTVEKATNGEYQIARIRGIPANELKDSVTLTVTAGEESGSVTYSPMNYCYNALNGGTSNNNLKNVIKALCSYAQAAESYFNNKTTAD